MTDREAAQTMKPKQHYIEDGEFILDLIYEQDIPTDLTVMKVAQSPAGTVLAIAPNLIPGEWAGIGVALLYSANGDILKGSIQDCLEYLEVLDD